MLAEIASGNVDTADWLFLIGAIIFGVAALVSLAVSRPAPGAAVVRLWWTPFLIPAGLCVVSVAWLVL